LGTPFTPPKDLGFAAEIGVERVGVVGADDAGGVAGGGVRRRGGGRGVRGSVEEGDTCGGVVRASDESEGGGETEGAGTDYKDGGRGWVWKSR